MPFDNELQLYEALRSGNEDAFAALIERFQASMIRVAMLYVPTQTLAEEAVQDTWIGVLKGLHRFEGRSSLKTWVFSILMNRAKTIAQREGRIVQVEWDTDDDREPAMPPDRFQSSGDAYPGHWNDMEFPQSWDAMPEAVLLSNETLRHIDEAIASLPDNQRIVITMRDVEMMTSEEVCNILSISETNQRVLLHRARSKVRRALALYLNESG